MICQKLVKNKSLIEFLVYILIFYPPLVSGAVDYSNIYFIGVISILMFGFWLFKMIDQKEIKIKKDPLSPFFLLFIIFVLFQPSIYKWQTNFSAFNLISFFLIYLVIVNNFDLKQIKRVCYAIIINGVFWCVLFIMKTIGISLPQALVNVDHLSCYFSLIALLSCGFFLSFFLFSQKYNLILKNIDKLIVIIFSITILSLGIVFTACRGGLFSFIGAILFLSLISCLGKIKLKKGMIFIFVFFLSIFAFWFGIHPLLIKLLDLQDETTLIYFAGRLPIWEGLINIIKDHPFLGTGFGTFNFIFPKYQPLQIMSKHYTFAHNDILELLSEIGILGFSIFVLGFIRFCFYAIKRIAKCNNHLIYGISLGIISALFGIFLHSFVDFNMHITANALLVFILLALFFSLFEERKQETYLNISFKQKHVKYFKITSFILTCFLGCLFIKPMIGRSFNECTTDYSDLKKAISWDKNNAEYHAKMGLYWLKESKSSNDVGELKKARKCFSKATALNTTCSYYYQLLAMAKGVLLSKGVDKDQKNVSKLFEKAIEFEPNNGYRYSALARWAFTQKNQELGFEMYKKAVKLEPILAMEAILIYYNFEKEKEKLKKILPGTDVSDYQIFKAIENIKGFNIALKFARSFFSSYNKNASLHFWIADRSYYEKKDWIFTKSQYNIVFQLEPNNSVYRMWYGIHLTEKGLLKKAVIELKKSVKMGLNRKNKMLAKSSILKCKQSGKL